MRRKGDARRAHRARGKDHMKIESSAPFLIDSVPQWLHSDDD